MTRTLPWQRRSSSSTVSKRTIPLTDSRIKRPRSIEPDPLTEGDAESSETLKRASTKSRTPRTSTSPLRPMESPLESFMKDGMENDDVFRMVEDEFLNVAKQYTQHLHAAEYQRMKIAAKYKNSESISSISRPVSIRMPEETRRKVESVELAEKQVSVLTGLLGKPAEVLESEDDTEEALGPWIGTALYGLMDSPRKRSASLTKFFGKHTAKRAALGFQRSTASKNSHNLDLFPKKLAKRPISSSMTRSSTIVDNMALENDSGDDLDAPLHPPKFNTACISSPSLATPTTNPSAHINPNVNMGTSGWWSEAAGKSIFSKGFVEVIGTDSISQQAALDSKARITRRLEQAQQKKIKEEKEVRRTRVEDIPMFLS